MTWHHHHDGDGRLIFCRSEATECIEEYDGLICNRGDSLWDGASGSWVKCRYHLAHGDYLLDVGEQMALLTHLEAVSEPTGDTRWA